MRAAPQRPDGGGWPAPGPCMIGPSPRVAATRTAVTALRLPAGTPVIVACSGGADSAALAAAVAFAAPREGWVARAVVIDHALRRGSDDDAARAAAMCRELGLATEVIRVEVPGGPEGRGAGGPEAAARLARYEALQSAAARAGSGAVVLLGHTLDDQAETVLLGLARGSGARSLAGMAPAAGVFRRPFLGLRRSETEGACEDQGIAIVVDPTNDPDGPWRRADGGPLRRVAVRHGAIPALQAALGPGVVPALARTADLLRADADHLDSEAEGVLEQLRSRPGAAESGSSRPRSAVGQSRLPIASLAELSPAVRGRVLHRAIMDVVGPGAGGAVSNRHVTAVDSLVVRYTGQGHVALPGGARASRSGGELVVEAEHGRS